MLPGRGTAVELVFFKGYETTKSVAFDAPTMPTRVLQLAGLSMGYATAVLAAELLLSFLMLRSSRHDVAFVLRVVDCMLPAARSLSEITLPVKICFASATFLTSLRTKWTAAAMVQMRRERGLLDVSETVKQAIGDGETRWRADVVEHGLKHCALPSCDKREASVQQCKFCSACRSVWYCSEEHGALHWTEHKPVCRATTAAQQAASDAGTGAA